MLPEFVETEAFLAVAGVALAPAASLRAETLIIKGSMRSFPRCVPPRRDRTFSADTNPGNVQRPPGLENAASSKRNGQPRNTAVPVKYCDASISSDTPGWKARYQSRKSAACSPA